MSKIMSYHELRNFAEIVYVVVFNSATSPDTIYSPIIPITEMPEGAYHGLDPELEGILPALEYILHLPRSRLDAVISAAHFTLLQHHDHPHRIYIIPHWACEKFLKSQIKSNILLFYVDDCEEQIANFKRTEFIDIVPISKLSSDLLPLHWMEISKKASSLGDMLSTPRKLSLLKERDLFLLPMLFPLNFLQRVHIIFDESEREYQYTKNLHKFTFLVYSCIEKNYLSYLSNGEVCDFKPNPKIPVILTMMGRPKIKDIKTLKAPSEIERKVSRIIATHRACANGGIVIEADDVPPKVYNKLRDLETHCEDANRPNNVFVWKTLNEIGDEICDLIGNDNLFALLKASHITAFTDFPIGLATIAGDKSLLCCQKPISYRPITPLTKSLQMETSGRHIYYMREHCKVLVAQCLDKTDPVRAYSDAVWKKACRNGLSCVNMIYQNIESLDGLKRFADENFDADILIISAHGSYDKDANCTGLYIGKEIFHGYESKLTLPPLIMLSSCHASPRGMGSVNVADMLLQAGAMAVIGTFIPISADRNSILYSRFITYIDLAVSKKNKDFTTVVDLWSWIVATNAFLDITSSNKFLQKWIFSCNGHGVSRIEDFMQNRSAGRLTGKNIYNETIAILREMHREDGTEERFNSAIFQESFFPESVFYQMIGYPENIYLYHPIHEEFYAKVKQGILSE